MDGNGKSEPSRLQLSEPLLPVVADEGGLRAPPHLRGWRKAWWWFDFIILVKLARLRFIGILVLIGAIITQWDTLRAYYERWTRPAAGATAAKSGVEYFCPMHPTVIRADPKEKCPICFMPLSKRTKSGEQDGPLPAGVVSRVQLSPYRVVLAGLRTWPVDYQPLHKLIQAVGTIEFDERRERSVSARIAGRIDKLYANQTGQMVKAGDPLASIYSPDLLVTVQNLRAAQRSGNREMLAAAKTRLELLGIDDAQVASILASAQPDTQLTLRSPIGGHIINKYVREGQYVQEGTPLYDVADLSKVWIQAQIYEDDLAYLARGFEHGGSVNNAAGIAVAARTRAFPNEEFRGKLAFMYPHVDQNTRTVTVRFELDNPEHKLRPGSTADVTLAVPLQNVAALAEIGDPAAADQLKEGKVLAVPESSVIDTGSQRIVYREASPGVYEGVEVVLGPKLSSPEGQFFYPLLKGLSTGDRVVTSGSFLIDAETRLNPAAGSIFFGGQGKKEGAADTTSPSASVRPSTPSDPDAAIESALARLSVEDQRIARSQKFCPVLNSRLGSMGPPVRLLIQDQVVFLCCGGCKKKALADPAETLSKANEFKLST